ncbi:hypothetical protein Tco_0164764 [Tanacetum coccineum]
MSQPANDEFSQHLSDDEASNHEDASDTVTAAEIQAVEKERKAKNILLMAIPKEHMRRFHGMDDAKEIWEAIRTRFGGNANSKKMQKAVFKQQFEAFTISSSEGSLPPAWSNLAMTMRTKPDVDTLSIDDLYNNLRVFEQEIQEEDSVGKPLYSRFIKTNDFKGVPHPLSGDYTPTPQEEIDESLYVYGKKGPQEPEPNVSDDRSSEYSTCQSNDSAGSIGTSSEHSVDPESEISSVPPEVYVSTPITTNEKGVSDPKSKEVEPSCVSHIKTPRQPIKDQATPKVNKEELECYDGKRTRGREAEVKKQRMCNTGIMMEKLVWTNAYRVKHANHFVPKPVQLNGGRPNANSVRPNVNTGRVNVNSVGCNVNTGSSNVNTVRSRQPVPTKTSNNFSPKRPQVNLFNQRSHFSKSYSSVRRPFEKITAQMFHSHAVKENWGSAVKTSSGYNWRNSKPHSNCDSGPTFFRIVNAKGPQGSSTEKHGDLLPLGSKGHFNLFSISQMWISSTRNTEEKAESRKSSTNSKKEEILTELQQEKKASSTDTSEDNPKILAFRRELEETSTPLVNTGSEAVNTGSFDPDDSPMPELEIFYKSETGIFDKASYDEEGVITYFNSLPIEIEVSPTPTLRIHNIHPKSQIIGDPKSVVQTRSKVQEKSGARALFSFIQKQQRNNHKDQQHCLFAYFLSQEEPKKISEALQDDSWVQAMQEELLQFKLQQMSSMGELTFFLGLQVKQNKAEIFISQDKYVAEILKKFDLVNVKIAITSMETKVALTKDEEAVDMDVTPNTSHLNAVKRIFKYIKGKPHVGLWYPRESPFDLEAYSDNDYGRSNLDRKSTTGGCQFLGQRLISWQCKKQTIVATSTTEAEYVAAANCCGQVLWVQNQLLDYGFNFMNTKIHIDNESTICIVKNPVYHSKTKHIEIRHHFIRDCYEKKLISVEKIHTDLNVADLLTKPFDGPRFNYLVNNPTTSYLPLYPASTPIPSLDNRPLNYGAHFEEPFPAHTNTSHPQEHAKGTDELWTDLLQKVKKLEGLVTPSKTTVNASGEEQVEDISPTTLEAAKTLSRVASQKPKLIDKGRRYKRRKETKGKKVVTSLDFQEGVNTAEGVNTGSIKVSTVSEQVSTDSIKKSIPSPDKGQREGKAPMISEETPKKTKEQILQEEASLAEAIRLDTLEKEEEAKQVHMDSLLAQRLTEEEELNEQQKKRRAQVQFEAQHYTDEDWDLIRANIKANTELSKSMLGSDLQGEDFAKKMVELVNQRKKRFAEEKEKAKRNKPMTQSQLRTYMMNYLKNQGTWKLSQLKNLCFEEVKEEFDKLVK